MNRLTVKIGLTAAALAVVAVPLAAIAKGEGRHGPRASFEQLDADGNGALTRAEMAAFARIRFDAVDADGNGLVSAEEIAAHAGKRAGKRAERMLERRDANSDGSLSFDELRPDEDRIAKRFERVDTDEDGAISKAEFDAAHDARKARRGGGGSN